MNKFLKSIVLLLIASTVVACGKCGEVLPGDADRKEAFYNK